MGTHTQSPRLASPPFASLSADRFRFANRLASSSPLIPSCLRSSPPVSYIHSDHLHQPRTSAPIISTSLVPAPASGHIIQQLRMLIVIRESFDATTGEISQYHTRMLRYIDTACPKRNFIPVVGPYRIAEECNWVLVELRAGHAIIVLAICIDTLYLYAWKRGDFESTDPWYIFANENPTGLDGTHVHLSFDGNYSTIGDPHTVLICRESLINCVHTISAYPPSEVKSALIILILTFCATIRVKPIYRLISRALFDSSGGRRQLEQIISTMEKNWKIASDYYLQGRTTYVHGYGIIEHATINPNLSVLLWSFGEDYKFDPYQGWRPLEPQKPDDEYGDDSTRDLRRHKKGRLNSKHLTRRQAARKDANVVGRRRVNDEHRARDLFYALRVPDLFTERVQNNGQRSVFCPNEVPGLTDCWGKELENLYTNYDKENAARLDSEMICDRDLPLRMLMRVSVGIHKDDIESTMKTYYLIKLRVRLGLGFVPKSPLRQLTMGATVSAAPMEGAPPQIRWGKGECIGCGAFGQVFMGMNLDSGELLAAKQVLIGTSNASKEKVQAHIRKVEEEVKLLKNLSHPNIVRYLGTVREENTLNIVLEFVPGGCISSLLSNFGSFPEPVIRMYTKQLLRGLEYLHRNKIIHRDIKGANILVDNKGCIKLADFGASKQVAKAMMTAAKSMESTPYWMAPEVIVQTGCSFSADIWSVGCTVIEMATGKPPWSGQYQEVAALFHVGTTKSHPPIPEHLSLEAKNFLLKCLQEEPGLRPTASDLLQHPFVTGEPEDVKQLNRAGSKESCNNVLSANKTQTNDFGTIMYCDKVLPVRPVWGNSNDDDDMCQLDDGDDFPIIGSSFNPVSDPLEEWSCKFDISPEQRRLSSQHLGFTADHYDINRSTSKVDCSDANGFSFPTDAACKDDDEVTESKIRASLDEKALDLKKLQTPLYKEFQNSLNASNAQVISSVCKENISNNNNNDAAYASKLLPMTPRKIFSEALPTMLLRSGCSRNASPGSSFSRRISRYSMGGSHVFQEITSSQKLNEQVPPEHHSDITEPTSPSANISDIRKWKEELDQELERQRGFLDTF